MRTLSEAMQDLLNSRKMTGDDKPSYSLAIEGLSAGINWNGMGTTWRQPKAAIDAGGVSVEAKTNGKLIVCGMVGGAVYEGEVTDVDTLLGADDTATGWTSTGITTNYYGRCQVFRADGDLWLSVVQAGDTDEIASLRLYKSASGNGGDWALYSTVYSHTSGGTVFNAALNTSGKIKVLSNGRYVLGTIEWVYFSGFRQPYPVIYISDDKGVSWTKVYTGVSGGPTGTYFTGAVSTDIAVLDDGTLFWAWGKDYGTTAIRFARSDDNGSTWTYVYEIIDGTYISGGTVFSDGVDIYFSVCSFGDGYNKIGKLLQPKVDNSYVWLDNQPPATKVWEPIIILDNYEKLILIAGEYVLGIDMTAADIPVKSISISRNKNMAASLEVVIDNKDGAWSPDGTTHKEILWPNKEVTVSQGYGSELVKTFTGLIDRIEMSTFPQEIKVTCRDYTKYLLDQLVTKAVEGGNTHVLNYQAQTVEYIVTDLATTAGLTLLETIYTTGITVADITFSWCSWADAIQELADLCGADFGCDENGKFYFRKDDIPKATDWLITFTDGEAHPMYHPIVDGTVSIRDGETTYTEDTDYTVDYSTGVITSITIPDGQVTMSYSFSAYTFQEGVDIVSLGYTIDDADIYQKVVCYGQKDDGTTVFAQTNYTSRVYYNVLTNKYMKIDAGKSAQTVAAAQALTDRAEKLMRSRVRICTFAAIAVPQLQVGDLIQVIEKSSTISELYRITDLSTTMDDTYTMQITCYHHSYA